MSYQDLLIAGLILMALGLQIPAYASPIETLVMPGELSEAHASIETECSECHAAFSKTLQRDLCVTCHEHNSVLKDMEAGTGFHGRSESARKSECATCHIEHEGRDADIVGLDRETFNHSLTDFVLEGIHTGRSCVDCHAEGEQFRETPSECFACHEANDNHKGRLGEDCDSCHKLSGWQETTFDHSKHTDHRLTGAHQGVECALCHTNQRYEGIPTDCYSCHQIDDQHQGNFGKDCEQCHQTEDWEKNNFDHEKASNFPFQGQHSEISCSSCHLANIFDTAIEQKCVSCHMADDVHQGANNSDCGICHNPREWKNPAFDHRTDTKFPLIGAHADLDCRVCHSGTTTDMNLDMTCVSCHQVDDVHQQGLGENCARCHKETGWALDVLFDHDISNFPLIGMHSVAPCEACHQSQRFTGTSKQCLGCHRQDDTHREAFGKDCGGCHNPNDWLLWDFDHKESTGFKLEGAHTDLACRNCHIDGQERQGSVPNACVGCHRNDDVHSGEFGKQCSRCHNSDSFEYSGKIQ